MLDGVDWGTILGGGSFVGLVGFVARDLIRAFVNRRKVNAEAGVSDAQREVTLSKATLEAMGELQAMYERRIAAILADAQAQIAGARADAANAVASSMHEVSTARGEVSQARQEAASARLTVERIEQLLLRARAAVWMPGADDVRITKARELLGDGSAPLVAFANGSPR